MAIDATLVRRAGTAVTAVVWIAASMLALTGCGGHSKAANEHIDSADANQDARPCAGIRCIKRAAPLDPG